MADWFRVRPSRDGTHPFLTFFFSIHPPWSFVVSHAAYRLPRTCVPPWCVSCDVFLRFSRVVFVHWTTPSSTRPFGSNPDHSSAAHVLSPEPCPSSHPRSARLSTTRRSATPAIFSVPRRGPPLPHRRFLRGKGGMSAVARTCVSTCRITCRITSDALVARATSS